jgi:hypothetical protein
VTRAMAAAGVAAAVEAAVAPAPSDEAAAGKRASYSFVLGERRAC